MFMNTLVARMVVHPLIVDVRLGIEKEGKEKEERQGPNGWKASVLCIYSHVCMYHNAQGSSLPMCAYCRPIESIFEELVHEGVIIKCPKVRLSEYVGEYR